MGTYLCPGCGKDVATFPASRRVWDHAGYDPDGRSGPACSLQRPHFPRRFYTAVDDTRPRVGDSCNMSVIPRMEMFLPVKFKADLLRAVHHVADVHNSGVTFERSPPAKRPRSAPPAS